MFSKHNRRAKQIHETEIVVNYLTKCVATATNERSNIDPATVSYLKTHLQLETGRLHRLKKRQEEAE